MNLRFRALEILQAVLGFSSKKIAFQSEDPPFVYQLVYGTLRFYYTLKTIADASLKYPLSAKDQDIYIIILLGIYQIQYLDIAEYAIVQETVQLPDLLKKRWAKSLVNAILRRFLRERAFFEKIVAESEEGLYAHPQWLIDRTRLAWPEKWVSILKANNEQAPMHLRVNCLKVSREAYQETLKNHQPSIDSIVLENVSDGLGLLEATDVVKLPGFSKGWVSVQDAASQAVVDDLDLKPGLRILDACAAPGGKTCHILEREPNIASLVALDVSEDRLEKVRENLKRLELPSKEIQLIAADAAQPDTWFKQGTQLFDRILLDAPCSAIGVIRRHPDIKCLRTPKEVQQAVQKQKIILKALWPLLRVDGRLVYTTCSILPEENQEQIDAFIAKNTDAKLLLTKQLLPGDTDGFFYAIIEKKTV